MTTTAQTIEVGQHVHVTAGVYRDLTGTVTGIIGDRAIVLTREMEGAREPINAPVRWLRVDPFLALPAPAEMRTPALVREYAANRVSDALTGDRGADAHARHIAIVDEMRSRGVLD